MGESLNGFEGKTVLRNIQTKSGNRVPAGLAVVACGAEPNLDLVRGTPLSGPHGSPVTEFLETEEKGIFAVGDLAFYPDRLMGGMRRQTHWENAREQGLIAGANMTGKKRIRYEQIPYFWTEMFDLRMNFVGDFSLPPTRVDINAPRAKKKFTARYYQGDKLRAVLLCQQSPRDVESAKTQFSISIYPAAHSAGVRSVNRQDMAAGISKCFRTTSLPTVPQVGTTKLAFNARA
jgi:3-phenylpropionate/trans-cinnamate dioxygenase ferredoxin reductase subunit